MDRLDPARRHEEAYAGTGVLAVRERKLAPASAHEVDPTAEHVDLLDLDEALVSGNGCEGERHEERYRQERTTGPGRHDLVLRRGLAPDFGPSRRALDPDPASARTYRSR
jgi:hypothetical protein